MQQHTGDIWTASEGTILITTNNVLKGSNHLVMGAGLAHQACKRFPTLPALAGQAVSAHKRATGHEDYHLIQPLGTHRGKYQIGILQTKRHWRDPSPLDLVTESLRHLYRAARRNPEQQFHTVIPGTGHGGLAIAQVMPMLEHMPDNVHVWTPR